MKMKCCVVLALACLLLAGCDSILVDVESSEAPASIASESAPETISESSDTVSENLQLKEYDIKQDIKDSIKYYNSVVTTELPKLAKDKDTEQIISKMEEAIERLDSDTDKYLVYMNDESLSDDLRKACENVKTAFYGISSTVLKPTLAIFKGESNDEAPDYGTMVIDAQTNYLDPASEFVK